MRLRSIRIRHSLAHAASLLALGLACGQAAAATSAYSSIDIAQPANGETVFNNEGDVEVKIVVRPALRAAAGDRIALAVDGEVASTQAQGRFALIGIARGTHTLQARVVDRAGDTLLASAPLTFHLWHASRLFPNRRH